jgi:hypothetical protein
LKIGVQAVLRADLHDGFLSLKVHVQEDNAWLLPRRTDAWKMHISIGMSWDIQPELVLAIPSVEYPLPATRPSYSVLSGEKLSQTFGIQRPFWLDAVKDVITEIRQIGAAL